MNLYEIEIDSKRLLPFVKKVEDVFIENELSNKEVFVLCLWYLVKASDALELTKNAFMLNSSNYWDTESKFSSDLHKDKLQ